MSEQLLKVADVVARLRLSRATVYNLLASGSLPSIRIGRARRVRESTLNSWIRDLEVDHPIPRSGRPWKPWAPSEAIVVSEAADGIPFDPERDLRAMTSRVLHPGRPSPGGNR